MTTTAAPSRATERRPAPRRMRGSDEGSLDRYLRDISAFPLITREQEAELARRIRNGDRDALDTLVRANLRFVISVAKKYQHQGVALADLISEGNLGLIRAAHKFDETKATKFISYAVWWIRQAMLQALAEQGRIVRVPLKRAGVPHRIRCRAGALDQAFGREATCAEIAAASEFTADEVTRAVAPSHWPLSLDAPVGPDQDTRLLDYLADEDSPSPDDDIFERAVVEAVGESLAMLKEREAKILRLYFGLDGCDPMTLEDIGVLLGVTRERVRQIKEKGISRLRQQSRARNLARFLD